MSKVKIQGNASGTGVVTLTAPNTNTDRTITLPDDTQTLIGTNASGNVGIGDGTIAPTSMLQIYKSLATADLALQSAGASGRKHILQSKTDGALAFYDSNASSERMRIDSAGAVTMPSQPFFYAKNTGVGSESGDGITTATAIFPTAIQNIGGHLSNTNSRFTAPITGRYFFSGTPGYKQTSIDFAVRLKVNGADLTDTIRLMGGNVSHSGISFSSTIYLNANDYVELNMAGSGSKAYHRNNSTVPNWWSGGLL